MMKQIPSNPNISKQQAEQAIKDVLRWLGENPERDELKATPGRVLELWQSFLSGYATESEQIISKPLEEVTGYLGQVVISSIEFISYCEHHLLPFKGLIDIGYIPDKKIAGLSTLTRLAEHTSKKLQTQERLTAQIASQLETILQPKGVIVRITATHDCLKLRNNNTRHSMVNTMQTLGQYQQETWQNLFLSEIQSNNHKSENNPAK